ncbi:hypothetical protein MMUR_34510 [Mycolicibacterium murale]|jgi:hypothetical protein|uniref:Uncharacterized protein n=1 Tax=Mycolicibacterium murale TaxID=182220 RepID=A0A7I9WNJ0_9MYCO|nr:hypothetical protein [Mycolicibacterium murale]MCV7184425.1 hypothetical protein [Mycolicibacterium murale]GFG59315.1 hypothetical protein MMUR_34510 [Mycolicibacterium murale]
MTSQSDTTASRWRRATVTGLAGAGLAASLMLGLAGTANADVLDDLEAQYGTGSGGGQVANLLNDALVLRAQGIRPKPADLQLVQAAAANRGPNQAPLVGALQQTVSNQQKVLAQMGQQSGPGGVGFSINQGPWQPNMNGNPMIRDDNPIFPMPGR